ncbi:hypothetical protein CRUP_028326, partial [Coryphaenoides rupestris]
MSSSFFIKKSANSALPKKGRSLATSKRKSNDDVGGNNKSRAKKPNSRLNEEISSDSETEATAAQNEREEEEEELDETPQEKKLRLAKSYLDQLRDEEEKKAEEESFESEWVAGRLQDELLEQKGKLQRSIAKDLLPPDASEIRVLRGHKLPITCLVISPDEKYIFSAAKDCSIIKWDVETGTKLHKVAGGRKGTEARHVGHTTQILCMAISSDGKYLATGDMSKLIIIWEPETCKELCKLKGHKGPVSALSFRTGTHDLYSASHDRSVKVWNVDEKAYVETLYGHQDAITGLDALSRERCVTAGGRDNTCEGLEDNRGVPAGVPRGSIDCIQLINEEHMITGSDDGSVSVWSVNKKKPLSTVKVAHGSFGDAGLEQPHWVASVAALRNSDTVASGCSEEEGLTTGTLNRGRSERTGFINALEFSTSGKFLVAGVGQEH